MTFYAYHFQRLDSDDVLFVRADRFFALLGMTNSRG